MRKGHQIKGLWQPSATIDAQVSGVMFNPYQGVEWQVKDPHDLRG